MLIQRMIIALPEKKGRVSTNVSSSFIATAIFPQIMLILSTWRKSEDDLKLRTIDQSSRQRREALMWTVMGQGWGLAQEAHKDAFGILCDNRRYCFSVLI